MTPIFTFCLIAVSVVFLATVLWKIRQEKLHISDSIFWIILSGLFLLFSIFPGIIRNASIILGIEGMQNLLFLIVIGVLLIKLFDISMTVSRMEDRIKTLTQIVSIEKSDDKDEEGK